MEFSKTVQVGTIVSYPLLHDKIKTKESLVISIVISLMLYFALVISDCFMTFGLQPVRLFCPGIFLAKEYP